MTVSFSNQACRIPSHQDCNRSVGRPCYYLFTKRPYHLRSRQGISEAAFNKHLECLGFRRIRVRVQSIVRCMRAPRLPN